jgi:hypothetical protein
MLYRPARLSIRSHYPCYGSMQIPIRIQLFILMRIRIRIRIQEAKPMRIQADQDLVQTTDHKKSNFDMKNIHKEYVVKRSTTYLRWYKSLLKRQKTRFIYKFCPISMLLDPEPNADPGGSGSTTLHYTVHYIHEIINPHPLYSYKIRQKQGILELFQQSFQLTAPGTFPQFWHCLLH